MNTVLISLWRNSYCGVPHPIQFQHQFSTMFWRRDEEKACGEKREKILEFLGTKGQFEIGEFPVGEVFPHERNFVGEEMSSGEGVSRKWDFSGTRIFGGNVSPKEGVFPEGKTQQRESFRQMRVLSGKVRPSQPWWGPT